MKKQPIILINIYYSESGYGDRLNFPPIGIAYISEYLNIYDIDHHIIDMGLGYTPKQILEKIKSIQPKWIGISINSLLIDRTRTLIEKIKEINPTVNIVAGGPHATTQGIKIFSDIPSVDYAIVGEGEISFYELKSDKLESDIKGLVYKAKDGSFKINERRIMENLDNIPFPKFEKFELNKYSQRIIPIISSRGCPFKCIFCQQSSLLSKNWRGVSAEYFIENIKYWVEKGCTEIHILDDNFTFNQRRLEKIVELYEKENIGNIKIVLIGGIRISETTKKTLQFLKRLNIENIAFGVESFSNEVLKFIKKGTSESKIEETIKNATEMGFKVKIFLIIGFPYQTPESLRKTYKLVLTYPIYQVRFFNLVPYEKTALMEWIDENGELIFPPDVYMNEFKKYQDIPLFNAKNMMSVEERIKQLRIAKDVTRLVQERSKYLFDESTIDV